MAEGPEIARRLGCSRQAAYTLLYQAIAKAGVDDVALLTRWAMLNGLDEPAESEIKEETRDQSAGLWRGCGAPESGGTSSTGLTAPQHRRTM